MGVKAKQHVHMGLSPGGVRRGERQVSIVKSLPKSVKKKASQQRSAKKGAEMIKKAFEMGPFEGWIPSVLHDSNLKIPQFVLYNGRTKPQEYICRYKAAMSLVTAKRPYFAKSSLAL